MNKKNDTLWQKIVTRKGRCELCGQSNTVGHHLFSRQSLSMRWNLDNGIELCHECHTKIHAKPFDWVKNEILTYNKYAELRRQSKKVIKYLDKKEVYNKLLQVYKGSLDWADYQSWWNNA